MKRLRRPKVIAECEDKTNLVAACLVRYGGALFCVSTSPAVDETLVFPAEFLPNGRWTTNWIEVAGGKGMSRECLLKGYK